AEDLDRHPHGSRRRAAALGRRSAPTEPFTSRASAPRRPAWSIGPTSRRRRLLVPAQIRSARSPRYGAGGEPGTRTEAALCSGEAATVLGEAVDRGARPDAAGWGCASTRCLSPRSIPVAITQSAGTTPATYAPR